MRFTTLDELQQAIQDGDVSIVTPTQAEPPTEAQTERKRAQADNLRHKFETLWAQLGGPPLEREYRFYPERKWLADYRAGLVLIELEGGVWSKREEDRGRHVRGKGYRDDCVKYNTAQLCGFVVFRFTTDMVSADHLQPIIDYLRESA